MLVEEILDLPVEAQEGALRQVFPRLNPAQIDALVEALMDEVIQLQWSQPRQALDSARLILQLADLSKNPAHRATGLRAEAQTRAIGLGEFEQALELYDRALAIYRDIEDEVGGARVQVTRIWALASLGRFSEAFQAGETAALILRRHEQWRSLAGLKNNLAMIYRRADQAQKALAMLEEAHQAYRQLGAAGEGYLANNALNRALVLYELGESQASLEASREALSLAEDFKQPAVAAIARHNLGITYFQLGRSNEALNLFDQAHQTYLDLGQRHMAAMCTLSSLYCLLELGRMAEVLEKSAYILEVFSEAGMRQEAAETLRIQALVFTRSRQNEKAIAALRESRRHFEALNNQRFTALADLAISSLMYLQGKSAESLALADACILTFEALELPFEKAQAELQAARAAMALGEPESARRFSQSALSIAEDISLPLLSYQARHILGLLSKARGAYQAAENEFQLAIQTIECLRGNIISEFQAGFFEEKEAIYEDMVALCLQTGRPEQGLQYAERAKSRALLNILANRVDLSVQARTPEDQPLVAEIAQLRQERERLLRGADRGVEGRVAPEPEVQLRDQQLLQRLEARISELWHVLLVRNAEYAREASLWEVQVREDLPHLDPGVLAVEYFALQDEIVLFSISTSASGETDVRARRLPANIAEIGALLDRLDLNFSSLPFHPRDQAAALHENARGILGRLYRLLLTPVEEELENYAHLLIIPHGLLHYLPFHAFHTGEAYLLEHHLVSYLPGLSFLSQGQQPAGAGALAVGYSHAGRLPYTLTEAERVAEIFAGDILLEGQATRTQVRLRASEVGLLHFACHGDFRPDNPLFSGLDLADGWLTTLDIFNLRLKASLVSLSACQTGRSQIGGGDELIGLTRAFLAAGTASLVTSQWLVEDRSTATLMERFYRQLLLGKTKVDALCTAQRSLMKEEPELAHPYFWAPFFLIGDTGLL